MTAERRQARRTRFSGIVLVRAEDFDIRCVGGDLSESGMRLFPSAPPPVLPTRLRVTFALPGTTRWLEAEAELVRQHSVERRTLWGVRFTGVEEETRARLRQFVADSDDTGAELFGALEPVPAQLRPLSGASSGDTSETELTGADPDTLALSPLEVGVLVAASLAVEEDDLPPLPPPDSFPSAEREDSDESDDLLRTTEPKLR
jgi:hypothetical protein